MWSRSYDARWGGRADRLNLGRFLKVSQPGESAGPCSHLGFQGHRSTHLTQLGRWVPCLASHVGSQPCTSQVPNAPRWLRMDAGCEA